MVFRKLLNIVFFGAYVLTRPRLFGPLFRGLYLPVYVQYEWLRGQSFRSVVDVGASRGHVSNVLLHLFPESTLYAFEPIPEEYQRLVRRVRSPRLIATQNALGNRVGREPLYASRYAPASSLLPVTELGTEEMPGARIERVLDVPCTTLDDFFRDRPLSKPVLLKIDVQGAERKVLEGGEEFLRNVTIICIETSFKELYRDQARFEHVYELLTARGFTYLGSTQEADFYPRYGIQSQENSVFARPRAD
jgi:FkbM family methyltransferase